MAVYTHLSADDLNALIAKYDVGALVSAKGIAEGVSNSNWLIETTRGRYILTMYERRLDIADLPFFLSLLDHLASRGCPVPATIHDRQGAAYRMVEGKAVALIEFLPGISIERPNPRQAHAVGRALAELHREAAGFEMVRTNDLRPEDWQNMLDRCDEAQVDAIDVDLRPAIEATLPELVADWPTDLPLSTIHADLFPDNVLMIGDRVGGLIDFYFACTDFAAYDLAVTHAAWCFDTEGQVFDRATSDGLIAGYCSERPLSKAEWRALPFLAQGAAMRFVATRTADWIDTPDDALVTRKNPMAFVRRMEFYRREGGSVFKPVQLPLSPAP